MEEDGDKSVANVEDRYRSKKKVPEPKDKIDLLIDDILSQNAETIVNLGNTCSTNIGDVT